MKDTTVSQLFADDTGQGTALRLGDIGDLKLGRIQLISRSERGYDGDLTGQSCFNQVQLTGNQINSVYDKIGNERGSRGQ